MKCVGASDPPCARCVKAGRKCEFLQPGQTPPAQPRRRHKPPQQQTTTSIAPGQDSRTGESSDAIVNRHRPENQVAHFNRGIASSSYSTPSWTPITPEPSTHGAAKKTSELPSVYSAAPLAIVVEGARSLPGNLDIAGNRQPQLKRRRTGRYTSEAADGIEEHLSERDMEQLLEL
jgi:hypothetical protein